jgi:AcrR family transcriptional regulator
MRQDNDIKSNGSANHGQMSWQQRHQRLLNTAISLFARQGFAGTTCKQIAKVAGTTQTTIFSHFSSKEDLYTAIINDKLTQQEPEFRQVLEEAIRQQNDRAVLNILATHVLNCYLSDPAWLRLLMYSGLEDHQSAWELLRQEEVCLDQFLIEYIRQRINDGTFRRVVPHLAARAFLGMIYNHALVQVLFNDPTLQVRPEQAVDAFVDIFLNGILNK